MNDKLIIEFNNFSFQYYSQSEPTLNDINLKIYAGEKILIVGPSGSGKSTLGHCLNGLIPFSYRGITEGSLKVKGKETKDQDIFTLSKVVGTVLQDSDGQFVGLTVGEDIAFVMENDNTPIDEMKERVLKVAQMVDMDRWLSASPYELSGGQKQRTALAGVMIDDVDVLLFDEPLANLDPATGKKAIEIIDDIHQNTNKTIIIIEHRLEDVLHREIDRIIVVNEGRILGDMNAHELVSSSILIENGIREPLYVTALKYAGVTVTPEMKPGHMNTLDTSAVNHIVKEWHLSVVKEEKRKLNESILKMDDVTFSYDGRKKILENINIEIAKGEMVSIVGRNGAGKSTLSKLLCGFEKEDQGAIYYLEEDIKGKTIKERAELIGVVMQNPNQMISKPMIFDEVALGLKLRNVKASEIKERVEKVLKICGLLPFMDWPISALSYGQKKRVTIASILVLNPSILILDEPTAGQDYKHYSEIMAFLQEINKTGITVIMITHDMHLMLEYTPRAIVISDGKKIADTDSAIVLTDHQVIEEANLKETSLYNLAKMVGIEDGTQFVQNFIDYERQVR
ncbi:ABC transporter ATP-binding protein [Fusibacter sp. 3D3]|uniref:ABC transporter ATP-binding protein n=1 Tax=Fusibacter sp. 3D3 TaxID=1048380 RepID=UPI000853C8D1|nr:ABC transporter ATP-binding protein [Fusibacter sp. 3D3]GAU78904.1 duplicated ATPase component MtsB of energizing module of methionine-regulated ECF transporter [Fusibacter sp. 3D3]